MSPVRAEFYGRLRKKIKVLNAESIYHTMQEMELEIEYERLCREFCRDDHSRWEKEDEKKSPNPNRNRKTIGMTSGEDAGGDGGVFQRGGG